MTVPVTMTPSDVMIQARRVLFSQSPATLTAIRDARQYGFAPPTAYTFATADMFAQDVYGGLCGITITASPTIATSGTGTHDIEHELTVLLLVNEAMISPTGDYIGQIGVDEFHVATHDYAWGIAWTLQQFLPYPPWGPASSVYQVDLVSIRPEQIVTADDAGNRMQLVAVRMNVYQRLRGRLPFVAPPGP